MSRSEASLRSGRSALILVAGLAACVGYALFLNPIYPIAHWLFWTVAAMWGWDLYLSVSCASFGYFVLRRVLKLTELPRLETLSFSVTLGAIAFVDNRDLVTVPQLCRDSWRIAMMTPERQMVNPFFTGGETISVSFPTNSMPHEAKLMSLRGNNVHFARATVRHMRLVVAMVIVMVVMLARERLVAEVLLAVEDQEVHAERVQRGDEHAGDDREVREARACDARLGDGLDDRVLRVEAGEERRADQRERADQRRDPRDRHVLLQAAHVAHVLRLVVVVDARVHRVDDAAVLRVQDSQSASNWI